MALAIAAAAGSFLAARAPSAGPFRSDFSLIRFGGEALLNHGNPYDLVGPGKVFDSPWTALYPATAYVFGIPFALLPEVWASVAFVTVSTFLLSYGMTRKGWQKLPLFLSVPFLWSVAVAQWSILFTAILFLPWLAFVSVVKPQIALPMIVGSGSRWALVSALVGSVILLATSLALLPGWPAEWLTLARDAEHLQAPLLYPGGILILLVLLRWRRRDSWLILSMALMPQTWYPYSILPLLAIPATLRESLILVIIASLGAIVPNFVAGDIHSPEMRRMGGALVVATAYVPAVMMVLRRENAVSRSPFPGP